MQKVKQILDLFYNALTAIELNYYYLKSAIKSIKSCVF